MTLCTAFNREEIFLESGTDSFCSSGWISAENTYNFSKEMIEHIILRPRLSILKNSAFMLQTLKLFLEIHNIPLYAGYWEMPGTEKFYTKLSDIGLLMDNLKFNQIQIPFFSKGEQRIFDYDWARDYLHPSPNTHFHYARKIFETYGPDILGILNDKIRNQCA